MSDTPLQDQTARDTIVEALDQNLMVLAGAGAGKTHALIERMVNTVRTGIGEVDRLAAITFTRKAAGEIRGRFFLRLRELAEEARGEEAKRIARALEKIDQCFIGTIHSFCGQLLRERPVEAGLPPDFSEVEDREETVQRRESWDRFVQNCFLREDPRLSELEHLGLRAEDLFSFFRRRCQFSDLKLKPTAAEMPDLEASTRQSLAFIEKCEAQIPDPLPGKKDPFQEVLTSARYRIQNRGIHTPDDRLALITLLMSKKGKSAITLKAWKPNDTKELRDHLLPDFQTQILEPVLAQWRQYIYQHVAEFVDDAVKAYQDLRHSTGRLTFQDLLELAAQLLKTNPDVRSYFQDRYQILFVDEFQDTDPIQAEVLLYLTGTDTQEPNWRNLSPRPGSLFLVGDEKQSIYRFRRADVGTFRQVRDCVAQTGGEIVQLNTSFRSLGHLCDWINPTFEALFVAQDPHYQAAFGPLFKHLPDGRNTCVRQISIEKIPYHRRTEIVATDADRIAGFIAAALKGETELNQNAANAVLPEKATPGDFMVLTRNRLYLSHYTRALEARGIPYDIIGGRRLGDALEIQAFADLLETVHTPDNPLPLLSYLRGDLVGLSDDELYDFHLAGGKFNWTHSLPDGLEKPLRLKLQTALDRLFQTEDWLHTLTPAAAIAKALEALGLLPVARTQPQGSTRSGNLYRVLALTHQWESQGFHWGQILSELRDLIDDTDYDIEEMTLESGRENVVRLMNLHQAKGLQARVVFLADPYDSRFGSHPPDFHVSRQDDPPYLSLLVTKPRGAFSTETIAEPQGWATDSAEEQLFLQAENLRLLYVAATRAERLLVVSHYEGGDKGPWTPLYPYLKDIPELPQFPPTPPPELKSHPLDWDHQQEDRKTRWQTIRTPTHTVRTVTGEAPTGAIPHLSSEGRGREYGTTVHQLFDDAVNNRLPEDEDAYIHHLLHDINLGFIQDARNALNAFRSSDLWGEIQTADTVYTEIPFAVSTPKENTPNILRGVIDLLYRTDQGWKLVDYKTDAVKTDAEIQSLIERSTPQLAAYAERWECLSKETVFEKGIWITEQTIWQAL